MFDDSAVCRMYSYLEEKFYLNRIMYSIDDNGNVTLGDVREVHVVYEDVPDSSVSNHTNLNGEGDEHADPVTEPSNADTSFQEPVTTDPAAVADPAPAPTDPVPEFTNPESDPAPVTDPVDPVNVGDPTQVSNAQIITEPQKGAEPDAVTTQEEGSGPAALTDGERAEFEALKREKKENLIKSYSDKLDEDVLTEFSAKIDETSFEDLEKALADKYASLDPTSVRIFAPIDTHKNNGEKTLGTLIKENL